MNTNKPAMTSQQATFTGEKQSPLELYRDLVVGSASLPFFVWYELSLLVGSNLPGICGFGFRSLIYPSLFKASGSRQAIGKGVTIRNPKQITLGKKVLIDDYATLDVRGDDASIEIGSHVCIGRFTTIAAKRGRITLADGVNIGSYCRIATQSSISIGESALVAAYAYVGPGNHQRGDDDSPLISQEMEIKGGVTIGAHCWIGARATILDGVKIGAHSIVGAHSLVREDVPDGAVVAGTPAKIISKE